MNFWVLCLAVFIDFQYYVKIQSWRKTVQSSIAFDRAGHLICIFNTVTSYGSESVCSLCNKRQASLHWNWRIERKKQLDINSTLYKVMYERTTEFVDLWMIINVKDCRHQKIINKQLSWIKASPVRLKIPRKVTVSYCLLNRVPWIFFALIVIASLKRFSSPYMLTNGLHFF